ncbi:MAG: DUF3365 domain-containing protein [Planctomycetota bacterium]|nr:DUF3365 domain-containing protein [Planctomycetota bacterium]MDA1212298.1 DUF3365 domain-containing protein [Planctomycetota bacterium]
MTKHTTYVAAIAVCLLFLTFGLADDELSEAIDRATVTEARRQAEILHVAMHHALHAVHHAFYREDQGLPIPAEVLKDVFKELEDEQHVTLRWLAVEGQAMNTDHKPRNDFERAAAKALASGESSYEGIDDGIYRRAGPITLTNHCLKCHVPDRKSTEDRTAGLIISMEIDAD